MLFLAGGAALRESVTVDEVSHIGSGLSYLQRLDLRLNPEHPPLAKLLAALPLALRGTRADYSSPAWKVAENFFPAYMAQWVFGDAVLGRWNPWRPTLLWARFPMLLLTLLLGWVVYVYASRLGGPTTANSPAANSSSAGLLCLALYVSTPAFLVFGPLVITDLPVTLFTLIALWQFGEIWTLPSRRNALRFGLALAAALLSKFTGLLIVPIILAFFLETRFHPTALEPRDKAERRAWRRARWRAVFRSVLCASLVVYGTYLIFSLGQSDDVLNRIGSGPWASLIRRPLMPLWLYLRGLLLMLLTGSRPTFILGRPYPHGLPFYFPIVFALKSTLGFVLLLALAAVLAILFRRSSRRLAVHAIPERFRPHWRILLVGFFVFLIVCLLSRLDISVRHFSVPILLLILMLAPLPNIIALLPARRWLYAATALLAASSLFACLAAYPYFFPFINSLAFHHPVYELLNDSNVSWNEGLPAVEAFAQQHHLSQLKLDWASLSDPALIVPEAQPWDCQLPTAADAGHWVVVAAVSILENRNCGYLMQYPHQPLAGGSLYAFQLPQPIPAPGAPGGPPLASARKEMWAIGLGFDLRAFALDSERHPDTLPAKMAAMMRYYQQQQRPAKAPKPAAP